MREQGKSDCEQHEVGLLGVLEILRRMEWKQGELDKKKAAAQWLATVALGIVAVGLGALTIMTRPYPFGMEMAVTALLCLGVVLWFVAAFRLSPKVSSTQRKADLKDVRVAGHGF